MDVGEIVKVIASLATLLMLIGGIFVWVGAKKAGDVAIVSGLSELKSEVKAMSSSIGSEMKLIHQRINKLQKQHVRLETRLDHIRPLIVRPPSLESEDEEEIVDD